MLKTDAEKGKMKWLLLQQMKMNEEMDEKETEHMEEELRSAEAQDEGMNVYVEDERAGREKFGQAGVVKEATHAEESVVLLDFNPGCRLFPLKYTVEKRSTVKFLKQLGLNSVSRMLQTQWLHDTGLKYKSEDQGDEVIVNNANGDWLLD